MEIKITVICGSSKAWEIVEAENAVSAGLLLIDSLGGGGVTYEDTDDDGNLVQIYPHDLPPQKLDGHNGYRGTCPAYYVAADDQITIGEIIVMNDQPVDGLGILLRNDFETREIKGYKHRYCQSYNEGSILIPLKSAW